MEQDKRYIEEDEITLKELILNVQKYFWEVVRNGKVMAGFIVFFAIIFYLKAAFTPITYEAELTFMVNEDDGNSLGGVSAILGQIGIGGGGKGKNNLNKILELAKSRAIVQRVIFDSVRIDGKSDFLGNHVIELYNFHEDWADDTTGLKDFIFTDDSLSVLSEKRALKSVYKKIIGSENTDGVFTTKYSDDTGIMRFATQTVDEELSIQLCKTMYSYLSNFYILRSVEKQQQTFDVMLQKVDSVKTVMTAKEYQLANFIDQNRGLYTARAKSRELELQRDVRLLNEMYAVTIKNFEIADFSLRNKTPFIQLIDEPLAPLGMTAASTLKNAMLGGALGGFLGLVFIIVRMFLINAINEE